MSMNNACIEMRMDMCVGPIVPENYITFKYFEVLNAQLHFNERLVVVVLGLMSDIKVFIWPDIITLNQNEKYLIRC